jgi:RNA polymerase sigma-70 factor, ECF subfamily
VTDFDTKRLLDLAQRGDAPAADVLLQRHRERLKRMVGLFLDPRVRQRVDPSDIVQETLLCAARRLPELDAEPAGGFYPWLREMARERILDAHRKHVRAGKRSVIREDPIGRLASSESTARLAEQLVDRNDSPSRKFEAAERKAELQRALDEMDEPNRELLLMRYVEQMKVREIAGTLAVSEAAVKSRLGRALARLSEILFRRRNNSDEQFSDDGR